MSAKANSTCVTACDSSAHDSSVAPVSHSNGKGGGKGKRGGGRKRKSTASSSTAGPTKKSLVDVLGRSKPEPEPKRHGQGTSGTPGAKPAFYHKYWKAVDQVNYGGSLADDPLLRTRCFNDNVMMRCNFCTDYESTFKPSTRFRDHLLGHCRKFFDSKHWSSKDVTDALKKSDSEEQVENFSCRT